MKCTRIQRIVLECDEHELSQEILAHLEVCAGCGDVFRQTCSCRELVALKRYEIPDALRREACLTGLHDRLLYLQTQPEETGYSPHPALRYGIAAAVVAMVAAHMVAMNGAQPLRSPVTLSDFRTPSFEQFIAAPESFLIDPAAHPQFFETFPTYPTDLPLPITPPSTPTRPPSVFFVDEPGTPRP